MCVAYVVLVKRTNIHMLRVCCPLRAMVLAHEVEPFQQTLYDLDVVVSETRSKSTLRGKLTQAEF